MKSMRLLRLNRCFGTYNIGVQPRPRIAEGVLRVTTRHSSSYLRGNLLVYAPQRSRVYGYSSSLSRIHSPSKAKLNKEGKNQSRSWYQQHAKYSGAEESSNVSPPPRWPDLWELVSSQDVCNITQTDISGHPDAFFSSISYMNGLDSNLGHHQYYEK